ncbi:MAG: response regulator transcription factor [Candidatus Krumholzibacteria bacterium]|nr:response regulator transcription factor [Candidatus Krumholzibacteria bacterium]
MKNKVRVLFAEDHTMFRQGIRRLVEEESIEVVGEVDNGQDAISRAIELSPDVVIMDISMPIMRGIEATTRIKKDVPGTKVIILTIHNEENYLFGALDAGADGYVVKGEDVSILLKAIETVMDGEFYLSSEVPSDALEKYEKHKKSGKAKDEFSRLTNREREILQLIAEGYTSKIIGEKKFISVKTVENHRANIMNKLDIHETAGLVRYAIQIGLVDLELER